MTTTKLKVLALVAGMFGAGVAAGDFDGSEPLMCSFGQVIECDEGSACRVVSHESVDAPDFVKLNFRKKQLMSVTAGEDGSTDDFTVTDLGTHLIVQASQGGGQGDALGYSLSIDQASGRMVAAGAGENAGFVIFGACAPN